MNEIILVELVLEEQKVVVVPLEMIGHSQDYLLGFFLDANRSNDIGFGDGPYAAPQLRNAAKIASPKLVSLAGPIPFTRPSSSRFSGFASAIAAMVRLL